MTHTKPQMQEVQSPSKPPYIQTTENKRENLESSQRKKKLYIERKK